MPQLTLDRNTFLADYWQREALFIPGAIAGFIPPVRADELAGLAMEPEIEARIIEHSNDEWLLSHGPFSEADFQRNSPWTLLVQVVDHVSDAVADLRRLIDFIPQWRVDDVMVSYASDGGSVGPHYDNYDVFLLQGEGQRRWRLGQRCDTDTPLVPHEGLRILAHFEQEQEYLLNPGDILYVPPGVAHWGIAEGECTTFSIGFRAPRVNALLSRRVDQLLDHLDPDCFYQDAARAAGSRAGEITDEDIERAHSLVRQAMQLPAQDNWFGELVTEPREQPDTGDIPAPELLAQARASSHLDLAPEARLAWQATDHGIQVYANGATLPCSGDVLPLLLQLCGQWRLAGEDLEQALAVASTHTLLSHLAELGCLYVRE